MILKSIYISIIFSLLSCVEITIKSDKNKYKDFDSLKTYNHSEKTIRFLWLDSNSSIIINKEFINQISNQEKAAIGYVATFVGNECDWDGEADENRINLKCKILSTLNLGYQCSDKHLNFLKLWFNGDSSVLKELENCPTIPNTSTIQESFVEIVLKKSNNNITIYSKTEGVNLREEKTWNKSETYFFQYDNQQIKLVKKD